jgi:hypothetical protein
VSTLTEVLSVVMLIIGIALALTVLASLLRDLWH